MTKSICGAAIGAPLGQADIVPQRLTHALQHLMALPVPILDPPQPLAAMPIQASDQACKPLHIPSLGSPAPLQPSKLATWKLFMDQVTRYIA